MIGNEYLGCPMMVGANSMIATDKSSGRETASHSLCLRTIAKPEANSRHRQ